MNRVSVWCVIGVVAVVATSSCSSDSKSTSGMSVDVEARESGEVYSLVADRASVPAGSVTIKLSNKGTMQHEMVVLKTDDPIDGLAVDADQKVSEDSSVGEVGELDVGTSGTVTLDLAAGNYVLVCNIEGHYGHGMRTAFSVTG